MSITTTIGERFTAQQTSDLARLTYIRFGRDSVAAARAWERMMQSRCSPDEFRDLIGYGYVSDYTAA